MPAKKLKLYSTVDTENPKFEKYNGLPRVSYSAYTSWREDAYRGSFIAAKILGIPDEGNMFTDFGSACGEFLETRQTEEVKQSPFLSEADMQILHSVNIPADSEFEREIMIKRTDSIKGADYCILGYVDRATTSPEALVDVIDYKTGGEKKIKEYAGSDYNQTKLYAYALEEEGEEIGYVGVELLLRKGNTLEPGNKHVLRLEGTIEEIPTPYDKKEVEFFLEGFDKVVWEISDAITFYNKYFVD